MAGVIRYSGIVTKVQAMTGSLLTLKDYQELSEKQTVIDALDYLKNTRAYGPAFSDAYVKISHRDAIERRLMDSLYSDYMRLYRFSNMKERDFLLGYFIHYEVMIVKWCLRNVCNLESPDVTLGCFTEFFEKHSKLKLNLLNHSDSIPEYMEALKGSAYEKLFEAIYNSGSRRLSDYETALDLYYFKSIWKLTHVALSEQEKKDITSVLGTRIDLLNIQWIYRCKQHFTMENEDIIAMLIPISYKLKTSEIKELLNASSKEDFSHVISKTYYRKWLPDEKLGSMGNVSEQLLSHIYRIKSRKSPYSMAAICRYLYLKEEEINHIIPMIEGIRYGLSAQEIAKLIPAATVRS